MKAVVAALALLLAAFSAAAGAAPRAAAMSVPFVGCASDGQQGPQPAPRTLRTPALPAAAAQRLAYYRSRDLGVLAPRGWRCLGLYGSNGASLIVTPEPHDFEQLTARRQSLRGAFVEIEMSYGGTSGRFAVAEAIARFFPQQIAFARGVADERLMDAPLPSGPEPSDQVRRRGADVVEVTTPAGQAGFGIGWRFRPEARPVDSLVMLVAGEEPDLISVRARLPAELASFTAVILDDGTVRRGATGE